MNLARDYRSLKVQQATTEELLFELLSRSRLFPAPRKKEFISNHHEALVAIGNDDIAYIQVDTDSFQVLKKRIHEKNPEMK